jgi:hypothetical protein
MNWLTILTGLYKLIPYVVAGVEVVHTNESTETKTQLAQDALSIAVQGAQQVLSPNDAAIASNVANAVTVGIKSVQAIIASVKNPAPSPTPVAPSTALGQEPA